MPKEQWKPHGISTYKLQTLITANSKTARPRLNWLWQILPLTYCGTAFPIGHAWLIRLLGRWYDLGHWPSSKLLEPVNVFRKGNRGCSIPMLACPAACKWLFFRIAHRINYYQDTLCFSHGLETLRKHFEHEPQTAWFIYDGNSLGRSLLTKAIFGWGRCKGIQTFHKISSSSTCHITLW